MPTFEKTRSEGAEEAGMHRYRFARKARVGKRELFLRHHTSGFSRAEIRGSRRHLASSLAKLSDSSFELHGFNQEEDEEEEEEDEEEEKEELPRGRPCHFFASSSSNE
jgi:hypothetical protein